MATPLDLSDVQGDVLIGLPKKTETFFFFHIKDAQVDEFRQKLKKLNHIITSSEKTKGDREKLVEHKKSHTSLMPLCGVNIAFSRSGLNKLGFTDGLQDTAFEGGMFKDRGTLGDNDDDLDPRFQKGIDGVILICGDTHGTVHKQLAEIKQLFSVGKKDAIVREVLSLSGDVRKGHDQDGLSQKGHEHFGFLDGVSQPAVEGVGDAPQVGEPAAVPPGAMLLGREGDNVQDRPDWALDGSFLAFRYLPQRVPEFDEFLVENALPPTQISAPGVTGSEMLGARMVGRWKNGTPTALSPTKPEKKLAHANDFTFDKDAPGTQVLCPFAAHIRKTNPRGDLGDAALANRRIMRRGIPFGPEVSKEEAASHTTCQERGLLFVCYQSNLTTAFQFIQHSWANQPNFIFGQSHPPGFDPIIGQNSDDSVRVSSGMFSDPNTDLSLGTQEFVVSKGGEYFFSPSIPTLKKLAAAA